MAAVLLQADERARKNVASILQALASASQANVAKDLGVSESAVSRMKDKEIPDMAKFLAVCGLKVVPADFKCVDKEYLAGLQHFARCWLEHVTQNADKPSALTWD
jgi:hypothetical protein